MVYLLILIGFIARLLPHAPNFSPLMALGLFAGCYLGRGKGMLVVVASMLLSNFILGFYSGPLMLTVYLSIATAGMFGGFLTSGRSLTRIGLATLGSALLFFIVTNFAVWAFGSMYPKSLEGIVQCYIAAIPYFRNSLVSNIFYVTIFFGLHELAGGFVNTKLAKLGTKLGLVKNGETAV